MVLIVSVYHRRERTRINEDHRRPRLWRSFRSFVNLRPICCESLASPPRTTPSRSLIASYGFTTGSSRPTEASMARRMNSDVDSPLRRAIRPMRCRVSSSNRSVSGDAMVSGLHNLSVLHLVIQVRNFLERPKPRRWHGSFFGVRRLDAAFITATLEDELYVQMLLPDGGRALRPEL